MSRLVDRGAITAAFVGIGVAVTMAMSFLLIIPIEPAYLLLSVPAGLVIGYYANARSRRVRGQWRRIVPNALLAGVVTGASLAALLLATKALFFFADNGYPDFNRVENGGQVGSTCETGADCVYRRYLAQDPQQLAASGVTDAASFSDAYWNAQWSSARLLLAGTTVAALFGGVLFGIGGPRTAAPATARRVAAAA
jgi:uncharacterized membrane protein YfcA